MNNKDKIKAECDKLTAEFQKLYGEKSLIIGMTQGHTYMDIPDNPKVLETLIGRLLAALVIKDKADHFEAVLNAVTNETKKVKAAIDNQMFN